MIASKKSRETKYIYIYIYTYIKSAISILCVIATLCVHIDNILVIILILQFFAIYIYLAAMFYICTICIP